MILPTDAILLLVDWQQAIGAPYWAAEGPRNHPFAEREALRLLAAWRAAGRRVIHVKHDSVESQSSYRPGQPGNAFKPGFEPLPGETVAAKSSGSGFVTTQLAAILPPASFVVSGVITNNSIETTVRHGASLGHRIWLAHDACFTFARRDFSGTLRTAEEVHAMSLANLAGEYAEIVTAEEVLQRCSAIG